MNNRLKAKISLLAMLISMFGGYGNVLAASSGSVVINEVAWAGSPDSANDEWIELYNTTSSPIDLTGWSIKDDVTTTYNIASGTIPAHGYFLIEDSENAVSNVQSDAIINISLANSGDSLQLLDNTAAIIDTVDGSGGAWYAGNNTGFASMERKDASAGDVASNFANSTGTGALGSAGGAILATPKALNSVSVVPQNAEQIKLEASTSSLAVNQEFTVLAKISNANNLFAYGFELNYDSQLLEMETVTKKAFLGNNGAVNTSFQTGLKGGQAGHLLVAEARTINPKVGVSGNGDLFEVKFKAKSASANPINISFAANSFASSPTEDLVFQYLPVAVTVGQQISVAPITNLIVAEDTARYALKLTWTASAGGADKYKVERKNAHGEWVVLGEPTAATFIDNDAVTTAGKLIPEVTYNYRVTAEKGTAQSLSVEAGGEESRGIRGDNNRTDLVDGRDLQRIAMHFAEDDTVSGFDALIDTTYDARVDGSDLIDLGANFAQAYP